MACSDDQRERWANCERPGRFLFVGGKIKNKTKRKEKSHSLSRRARSRTLLCSFSLLFSLFSLFSLYFLLPLKTKRNQIEVRKRDCWCSLSVRFCAALLCSLRLLEPLGHWNWRLGCFIIDWLDIKSEFWVGLPIKLWIFCIHGVI